VITTRAPRGISGWRGYSAKVIVGVVLTLSSRRS
jgi:hypothetical protein